MKRLTVLRALMVLSVTAAAGLFAFLALACPDRQLIGLVPAAMWVPLVLWYYSALRRRAVIDIAFALPVSLLTLVLTVVLICPRDAVRTATTIGLVAFVVYGLVLAASISEFEKWGKEEQ